jgi:L-seryl-tRNA(Ser) seleniumtransferase
VTVLKRRARRLIGRLRGLEGQVEVRMEEAVAYTGSGALPLEEIPSVAVTLRPAAGSVAGLARGLRLGEPAVVGYAREDRVWLDMRTVRDEEVKVVAEAIRKAFL